MTFTHVRYVVDGVCTVWCRDGHGPVTIPPPPEPQARCFAQPNGPDVTLQWLVNGVLRSAADRARVDPALADEARQRVALTIGFDHWPLAYLDDWGDRHPMERLTVQIRRETLAGTAVFKQVDYGDAAVAVGETTVDGTRFRVVKATHSGGNTDPGITVEITPKEGHGWRLEEFEGALRPVVFELTKGTPKPHAHARRPELRNGGAPRLAGHYVPNPGEVGRRPAVGRAAAASRGPAATG